ncbi:evolved beta-galactosidase subunit alpha [Pedobacter glucosidilyticus]|nr:evolved beta-galactosidase subunit alpha [Pedobacter glucosidilyticus]
MNTGAKVNLNLPEQPQHSEVYNSNGKVPLKTGATGKPTNASKDLGNVLSLNEVQKIGQTDLSVKVEGVSASDISLDGNWKFTMTPPEEFWKNDYDPKNWEEIPVPADVFALGFPIIQDQPFAYKREIKIPKDFKGQRILLHFEAVHNKAEVWINGNPIMTHQGGFTPWDCDITKEVKPGESFWLSLRVTDLKKEISFNGKALRAIGGIVRSVSLRARPKTFFEFPIVSSPFDDAFKNATLQVIGRVAFPNPKVKVSFKLFDAAEKEVPLSANTLALNQNQLTFQSPVSSPLKWDAEHPNLYRLEVTTQGGGQAKSVYSKMIGFRDIRFDEKSNLLINGKITKLRGANRHLSNPTGGKVPTAEYEQLDVTLAKEANINFLRTSHYPPGEGLLDQTDVQGIYVTLETAIVDVGKPNRPSFGMNDDPEETKHFLSQLEEMLLNYGSHPSTIVWSICNESVYGINFLESYKLCKKIDPSRPVTASYQIKKDTKKESYDIESVHYPKWDQDYSTPTVPAIYDEWIHVLGHTAQEWFHDPNARDYWGRSLDQAWSKAFEADGFVGGAIWNYIDDVTYLPDPLVKSAKGPQRFLDPKGGVRVETPENATGNVFGTARWGIIDEWRRRKPEFWNVKKAYSPIRVLSTQLNVFSSGKALALPIYNRFDHTNLNETQVKVTYQGKSQSFRAPSLEPHQKGELILPAQDWKAGQSFLVEFLDAKQQLIDSESITLGTPPVIAPPVLMAGSKLEKSNTQWKVTGQASVFELDPSTGLFKSFTKQGVKNTFEGPFLHLFNLEEYFNSEGRKTVTEDGPVPSDWKLTKMESRVTPNETEIVVIGSAGEVQIEYHYHFGANNQLKINYKFSKIPSLKIIDKKRDNEGPLALEGGIKFRTNDQFDELSWKRQGYWSNYPTQHLGALEGKVSLFSESKPLYRQIPTQDWEQDVHDWFYQGVKIPSGKLLTNISRSAKMGILDYQLIDKDSKLSLGVWGDGKSISCRFSKAADHSYYLYLLNTLNYHLRWGNYFNEKDRPQTEIQGEAWLSIL